MWVKMNLMWQMLMWTAPFCVHSVHSIRTVQIHKKENIVWKTVFCHALYMNKDTSVLMQQGHLQLLIVSY